MALSEIIKTIETFYNMHHTAININLFSTITAFVIGKFFNDILYFFKKIYYLIIGKKEPEPIQFNDKAEVLDGIGQLKIDTNNAPILYKPKIYLQQSTNEAKPKKEDDK